MVRACKTGWACNVFRNIDPDFIVHYFVHGGESGNFAPQFSWGLVQIVQEISECTGFSLVAVFLQMWRLAAVLLQYRGNAFEYVGPTRCRRIPDKQERG